ncbi:hypothetical protein, partial [Photorhabdus antumapuensis]|uniref:hypothetical protein n=1 Tax=Photorhabdus antumapuensis TaxID=2862867 RepID=UPI001CEC33E5
SEISSQCPSSNNALNSGGRPTVTLYFATSRINEFLTHSSLEINKFTLYVCVHMLMSGWEDI